MSASEKIHFRHRRLVEFADTDLAGIMHFANFFKFVECAEHAFFRSLGETVHSADGAKHDGWPRIEVSCKYHRPARFQETLEVRLRLVELRTTSLSYAFAIHSADVPGEPLLASGTFGIIHVELDAATKQIRKTPISAALRTKLEAAMAQTV